MKQTTGSIRQIQTQAKVLRSIALYDEMSSFGKEAYHCAIGYVENDEAVTTSRLNECQQKLLTMYKISETDGQHAFTAMSKVATAADFAAYKCVFYSAANPSLNNL